MTKTYNISGYTFNTARIFGLPANPAHMLQKELIKLSGHPVIDRELARRAHVVAA